MKNIGILFTVFAICFTISCNKKSNKKPEQQKQVAQTQQSKPAPTPAKTDTVRTIVKEPVKDTAIPKEPAYVSYNGDNLLGKWASKNSAMRATILQSKLGYYVQYEFGPVNSFYGNYKLVNGVLVCQKPVTYSDGGEIENEYVRNAKFKRSDDGRSLVFTCDDCETTTLYRVH